MAIAYTWAWRVITVSLEMVVPGLMGYWIDSRLGAKAVFVIAGFLAGMAMGVWHLIRIARDSSRPPPTKDRST
jgi:hypothetical protein